MAFKGTNLLPSFGRKSAKVAIRRAAAYQDGLSSLLWESLREFGLPIAGKHVLLKPNFVGPDPQGVINTHPAVVAAARECFLRLGAETVIVAEGPAIERDTEAIVESIRLRDYLGSLPQAFVDLNLDDVQRTPLRTHASRLRELYLPKTVLAADFVVSMPKMKTHRWSGVTLSLKNMFGIVPGGCYGWPKNALHWAGIDRAILDINSTVRPDFAIVDGIVGMGGNGPLLGQAKHCGVVVLGDDPVAVDATCARIMALAPERISHLARASYLLGHINLEKINQIGESVASVKKPFDPPPDFMGLREP